MIIINIKSKGRGKSLWRILADFVADFVAGSTKPLDYQGVLSANARCGRDSNPRPTA